MKYLERKIPPIVVWSTVLLCMWLISKGNPRLSAEGYTVVIRYVGMAVSLVCGGIVVLSGIFRFKTSGTSMNPYSSKASILVTGGIYSYSRNPMYLGSLVLLVAWALYLWNVYSFALVAVFVLYMNKYQIAPEEGILEEQFGEEYTAYKDRVRRWI